MSVNKLFSNKFAYDSIKFPVIQISFLVRRDKNKTIHTSQSFNALNTKTCGMCEKLSSEFCCQLFAAFDYCELGFPIALASPSVYTIFFFTMVQHPSWAKASSMSRIHDPTQTHHTW
jgi:hypothetical protein